MAFSLVCSNSTGRPLVAVGPFEEEPEAQAFVDVASPAYKSTILVPIYSPEEYLEGKNIEDVLDPIDLEIRTYRRGDGCSEITVTHIPSGRSVEARGEGSFFVREQAIVALENKVRAHRAEERHAST